MLLFSLNLFNVYLGLGHFKMIEDLFPISIPTIWPIAVLLQIRQEILNVNLTPKDIRLIRKKDSGECVAAPTLSSEWSPLSAVSGAASPARGPLAGGRGRVLSPHELWISVRAPRAALSAAGFGWRGWLSPIHASPHFSYSYGPG